jgi:Tfp pilus assembly protein PilN
VVEYLRVFRHVGFSVLGVAGRPQRPRMGRGQSQEGRFIMYIGGGLLTLVIVVVLVVFLLRRG